MLLSGFQSKYEEKNTNFIDAFHFNDGSIVGEVTENLS